MLGHSPLSTRPLSTIEVTTGSFSLVAVAGSYAIAGQAAVLEKVGLPGPKLIIIQSALRW